jgi:hypothetical protein
VIHQLDPSLYPRQFLLNEQMKTNPQKGLVSNPLLVGLYNEMSTLGLSGNLLYSIVEFLCVSIAYLEEVDEQFTRQLAPCKLDCSDTM